MIRTLFLILCIISSIPAFAKGSSARSSEGAKTQFVHGYDRADGTHVNSYYRHGPSANSYDDSAREGGEGPMEGGLVGVGKQEAKTAHPVCEYKAVMSDAEIAACRHH
jgi:hypothetical protein